MNKILIASCVNFARNIWSGTRFALFLPTGLWQFRFGFVQLCLLLTLSFLLSFTYDYLDTSPNNIFNIYGLTYQATLYLLFFISVVIIAKIENDMASIANVMIIFLAYSLPATGNSNTCKGFWTALYPARGRCVL